MKPLRLPLFVALMSLTTVALARSGASSVPTSEAQKSFALLKTLAGTWEGSLTTTPPQAAMGGKTMWVTLRVTSHGNAIVHEMKKPGTPDDPAHDDPITILYLDGNRLVLTHYCDAGNRPRMVATTSPDGKTVTFDFVDISGGTQNGYMHQAAFTVIDSNHHTEDWTYLEPGNKSLHAHFDLRRTN